MVLRFIDVIEVLASRS